jgi:hypothetical protein
MKTNEGNILKLFKESGGWKREKDEGCKSN